MKKVLIDSSVWVSFLAEDRNRDKATKIFKRLLSEKDQRKIIVPRLIYLEVINTLNRISAGEDLAAAFRDMFKKQRKLMLVKVNEKIYIRAEEFAKKVKLKTLDLLILTSVFDQRINKFISFDNKLRKAYFQLLHS